MHTRNLIGLGAVAALALTGFTAAPAYADPPEKADHGHLLLLDVVSVPGAPGTPPTIVSVGKCVEIAGGQPVGTAAHDDPRHAPGFSAGWFGERTGNVLVPTAPFEPAPGQVVPWTNCAEFLAFVGL
ncbi:hypothetical protein ARHIZOSPH14_24350 [Agromyces rhizosphaerae]|uniref:Secreted protein n=1 Tax=Agromyces rhizosphaerae TaxID=88374 RepID=A0A9W6D261_9MICO|nr:hypothetical protein [Agromyces rhizosphaerae]GLI28193.1 hypothetical protein ARHIZOSPH14_24350 [Agromyces rhizosphaerae]